jgi:hypothetical protein
MLFPFVFQDNCTGIVDVNVFVRSNQFTEASNHTNESGLDAEFLIRELLLKNCHVVVVICRETYQPTTSFG